LREKLPEAGKRLSMERVKEHGLALRYIYVSLMFFVLFAASPLYAASDEYELYTAEGIQKINEGEMKDAIVLLRKALSLSPENPEAAYYAGIAYSRDGDYIEAERMFLQALQMDETYANAYIELGRIYYVTSRCDDLETLLSKLTDISEETELKVEASRLVDGCRRKAEEKPYSLDVSAGTQYDSNVILEPSNPPVDAGRKSDSRAVFYLTSEAVLLKRDSLKLKGDYSFYQSLHTNLGDFNVRYHRISPALEVDISETLDSAAGYSLEYTRLGGDLYSRIHTYYARLTVKEGRRGSTEAVYEYNVIKYWDSAIFLTNSMRSGYRNRLGLKQRFRTSRLSGELYYFSDFKRAQAEYWAFNGQSVGAGIVYKIKPSLYLNLLSEYNERRYRDDFPGLQKRRVDRMQQYSVRLTYFLSGRMSASFTESYTVNDSNLGIFDYKRSITGIFLTVRVL